MSQSVPFSLNEDKEDHLPSSSFQKHQILSISISKKKKTYLGEYCSPISEFQLACFVSFSHSFLFLSYLTHSKAVSKMISEILFLWWEMTEKDLFSLNCAVEKNC